MENNLLNNIKSYFTEDVVSKLSSHLGEDHDAIKKGLDVSIPSLLLGLQSPNGGGLATILNSAKHLFGSFDISHILGNYFGSNGDAASNSQFESNNILDEIFGDKLSHVVSAVSNFLGIKSESVRGLLGASLPAVVSGITNKGANWDLGTITNLLSENKAAITSAIPAGLGLGAFGSLFAKAESAPELESPKVTEPHVEPVNQYVPKEQPMAHTRETVEETKKGAGLWWILIPILLLLLWFLFGKGCQGDKKEEPLVDTLTNVTIVDTVPMANVEREYIDVALPNGTSLKAYESGIEQQLINFLQSEDYKVYTDDQLKDKWFDFDNLNFETGTSKVTAESQKQLENIAGILSLFPEAKIKIGGYTDKTGDEAFNKKLSQERADAVKNYLNEKGLGDQVVGAEGYGSEFAKVPSTSSDEDRSTDRRVAVSVRK